MRHALGLLALLVALATTASAAPADAAFSTGPEDPVCIGFGEGGEPSCDLVHVYECGNGGYCACLLSRYFDSMPAYVCPIVCVLTPTCPLGVR